MEDDPKVYAFAALFEGPLPVHWIGFQITPKIGTTEQVMKELDSPEFELLAAVVFNDIRPPITEEEAVAEPTEPLQWKILCKEQEQTLVVNCRNTVMTCWKLEQKPTEQHIQVVKTCRQLVDFLNGGCGEFQGSLEAPSCSNTRIASLNCNDFHQTYKQNYAACSRGSNGL